MLKRTKYYNKLEVGGAQPSLVFPNSSDIEATWLDHQEQYVLTNGEAEEWPIRTVRYPGLTNQEAVKCEPTGGLQCSAVQSLWVGWDGWGGGLVFISTFLSPVDLRQSKYQSLFYRFSRN